jgi:uncharacterized membrane protein YbhN (UPF0104 family)
MTIRPDTAPMVRPRRRAALRLGGTALVLAGLAWSVDLEAALAHLSGAAAGPVLALLLLVQAQVWLSALRWRLIARRLGVGLPWPQAAAEYYAGTLLNQVLPGGVAGDAARAWRHNRRHAAAPTDGGTGAGGAILRAVVLERMAGQLMFLLLAGAGLAAWPWLHADAPGQVLNTVLTAAGAALVILVLAALGVATLGPVRWRRGLAALPADAVDGLIRGGAWRVQVPLNLAIAGSYVGGLALAAAAVGPALPWSAAVTVLPLTLLAMLLPVSVGGWGLREGAAAALWPSLGLSAELGVAAGLLYGLAVLAGTLPGALVLLRPLRTGGRGVPPAYSTSARKA